MAALVEMIWSYNNSEHCHNTTQTFEDLIALRVLLILVPLLLDSQMCNNGFAVPSRFPFCRYPDASSSTRHISFILPSWFKITPYSHWQEFIVITFWKVETISLISFPSMNPSKTPFTQISFPFGLLRFPFSSISRKRPLMVLSFPKKFRRKQLSLEKDSLSQTFPFKEDLLHVFQRLALLLQHHNPPNHHFPTFLCSSPRFNISCCAWIKCAASSIPCGAVVTPSPSASSADGVLQSIRSCAREHGSNTTML